MAIEEKIHDILGQYCNDEVMLDAFFQWATNPTSMSAGYGLEENYPYIKKNLALRYGLSPTEAERRLNALKEACDVLLIEAEQLPDEKHRIGHVQMRLEDILSHGDYGDLRTQGILRRLREASEETKKALLLFNLLEDIGSSVSPNNFTEPPSQYRNYQSEFQAYHKSIFGEIAPVLRVAREIVGTGAYNELYWVPSPGAKSDAHPTLVEGILPSITELEALGTKLPPIPDVPKLLEPYWEKDVEVLRLVDIVSHSSYCVKEMDEPLHIDIPNFMGLYGKTVALSPMLREVKQYIELTKDERMWPIRQTLEKALVAVEKLVEPQAGLGVLWSGQGEVVWKFTTTPPLYVYLAPWLTTLTQTVAPSRVNFQEKPHVLFVIPYQSRVSFLTALEKYSGFSLKETRWDKSLGLLTSLQKPSEFQLLLGERHPLLEKIFDTLAKSTETLTKEALVIKSEASASGKMISQVSLPEGKGDGRGGGGAAPSRERLLSCFTAGYAVKPPDQAWLSSLASTLQSILDELGIVCTVTTKEFQWGPRVVRANVQLSKGVRIKKVVDAAPDIANKLFARGDLFKFDSDDEVPKSVRVESVPAKGMVGIYIPRNEFLTVPIGQLIQSLPNDDPLSFPIGLNVVGQPQFSNLDSMPHLLVAGQTGAGKSVFLNCMIVSLAFQNDPDQLQFVLIDPKGGLEFGPYEKLPHVAQGQMVTSAEATVDALSSARQEMDNRYILMRDAAKSGHPVRKIQEYNTLPRMRPLAYRVIMVDEFADIVLSKHGSEVVELVQALAQKGRAAGFYMVICTQRPSVKVIPGDIKAVIPSRISFRLPASVDSRVILDEPGAEALLGKGDMFLKETTHPELRRFQGPFVTNEEVDNFVKVADQVWGSGHA